MKDKVFVKKGNEFDIKQDKKLLMLRRLEMFLSTHPDNEENSEMADRITDVEILIENEMRIKEVELPTEEEIVHKEMSVYGVRKDALPYESLFMKGAHFILNHIIKGEEI